MRRLLFSMPCLVNVRKKEWCTIEISFPRIFSLLIQSNVFIGCFIITNFTIRLNFWVLVFMNFCFHNHWWSLPVSSMVNIFAFSEGIRNIKKSFRGLRVKNWWNQVSTIIFEVKCLCFTKMCTNNGIRIVISIISRAVVVNEILNFTCVLVEQPDIIGNFFMSQLVTVQVLQGNISTQQIMKSSIFPGMQLICRLVNWVMITWYRKKRRDNLLFCAYRYNSGLWLQKILIGCGELMMKRSYVCRADMIPRS